MATNFYDSWEIGETYSFSSIVPGILPINYQRVKLEGINRFSIAAQIAGQDLLSQWREIYPSLPAGTPDTPNVSRWFNFVSMGGEDIVLAEQWIDGSTVVVTDFLNFDVIVTESSTVKLARLRDYMNQEGTKYQIVMKN